MSQQSLVSSNGQRAVQLYADTFPFASELSLAPLATFWQQTMRCDHPVEGALVTQVQQAVQAAPALLEPLEDIAILAQHQALVDTLMSVIFPRASWDDVHAAAFWPFHLRSVYATPSFARLLLDDDRLMRGRPNIDWPAKEKVRDLYAYAMILQRVYGMDIDFAYPLIYTVTDPTTGLDCHFKAQWDCRFVEVHTIGNPPLLTESMRNQLLANLGNLDVLMDLLPPEHFMFHGFLVLHALDCTLWKSLTRRSCRR